MKPCPWCNSSKIQTRHFQKMAPAAHMYKLVYQTGCFNWACPVQPKARRDGPYGNPDTPGWKQANQDAEVESVAAWEKLP